MSTTKMVAGFLAVAGMLILSSPGVRVARAGDGDAAPSGSSRAAVSSGGASGSCKVGEESDSRATQSAALAKIAERIRVEMQGSDDKPVLLNGRGYNYGISRDPQAELGIVGSEAARPREQVPSGR